MQTVQVRQSLFLLIEEDFCIDLNDWCLTCRRVKHFLVRKISSTITIPVCNFFLTLTQSRKIRMSVKIDTKFTGQSFSFFYIILSGPSDVSVNKQSEILLMQLNN